MSCLEPYETGEPNMSYQQSLRRLNSEELLQQVASTYAVMESCLARQIRELNNELGDVKKQLHEEESRLVLIRQQLVSRPKL